MNNATPQFWVGLLIGCVIGCSGTFFALLFRDLAELATPDKKEPEEPPTFACDHQERER